MNGAGRARVRRHPVPAMEAERNHSDFFSPAVTFGSPWRATQIPTPEFRRTIAARRETDITPGRSQAATGESRRIEDLCAAGRRARRGAAGREQAGLWRLPFHQVEGRRRAPTNGNTTIPSRSVAPPKRGPGAAAQCRIRGLQAGSPRQPPAPCQRRSRPCQSIRVIRHRQADFASQHDAIRHGFLYSL